MTNLSKGKLSVSSLIGKGLTLGNEKRRDSKLESEMLFLARVDRKMIAFGVRLF